MRWFFFYLFVLKSFTIQAQNYSDNWLSNDIAYNVSQELEWAVERQSYTNVVNLNYLLQLGQMFKKIRESKYGIDDNGMYWREKNDEFIGYVNKKAEIEKAAISYSGLGQIFYDSKKYYLTAQCFNAYNELTKKLPKEGNLSGQIVTAQYFVSLSLFNVGESNAALTFLLINDTKANLYKISDYELRKSASDLILKIEIAGKAM